MNNFRNNIAPPQLPLRFFRWFCRQEILEDIEGDLVEKFNLSIEEIGIKMQD
ncbi:MAG: hypothetical protein IPL46_02320 [Saprospiraceae bacterium]|nr:hypothetical protein [Saprospiraceae bacterium]